MDKNKEFKTVKHYANELNVSERTVHNYLKELIPFFIDNGYILEKRPGVGILLRRKRALNKEVRNFGREDPVYLRRKEIAKKLLFKNEVVTIKKLSQLFYVSESSIVNDLNYIESKVIQKSSLLQKGQKGTYVSGKESEIQKLFQNFNLWISENEADLKDIDFSRKRFQLLEECYGENITQVCLRVLYDYLKEHSSFVAEHYIFNILSALVVLVYRLFNGHKIEDDYMESEVMKEYLNSSNEILEKICLRLNITSSSTEAHYFSTHLFSNRAKISTNKNIQARELTEFIIIEMSKILHLDIIGDEVLQKNLMNHIEPMLYRLKEGIHINNPFLSQIKTEYPIMFNSLSIVLSKYQTKFGVIFNNDEIGFLTIHFQSSVERRRRNKKIIVVCPTGVATSELLVNKLSNLFPPFVSINVLSTREIKQEEIEQTDLIITTVDLSIASENIIKVSPLLTDEDMRKVSDIFNLKFQYKRSYSNTHENNKVLKYINTQLIFLNKRFSSKNNCLNYVLDCLIEENYVEEEYKTSVLKREELGGTDISTGVAIPHGNPKLVRETSISIITNKRSIRWDNHLVKVIILVSISENDIHESKNILSSIYHLISSKERIDKLIQCEMKSSVYDLLKHVERKGEDSG